MSTSLSPAPAKQLSKSASRKRKKSQYWRSVQESREALAEERDSFQQHVVVVTMKTTNNAESFSAIIDSRRGIVIK